MQRDDLATKQFAFGISALLKRFQVLGLGIRHGPESPQRDFEVRGDDPERGEKKRLGLVVSVLLRRDALLDLLLLFLRRPLDFRARAHRVNSRRIGRSGA